MSVSPIWPAGSAVNDEGEITFHGRTAASLLDEFGSPLYVCLLYTSDAADD